MKILKDMFTAVVVAAGLAYVHPRADGGSLEDNRDPFAGGIHETWIDVIDAPACDSGRLAALVFIGASRTDVNRVSSSYETLLWEAQSAVRREWGRIVKEGCYAFSDTVPEDVVTRRLSDIEKHLVIKTGVHFSIEALPVSGSAGRTSTPPVPAGEAKPPAKKPSKPNKVVPA